MSSQDIESMSTSSKSHHDSEPAPVSLDERRRAALAEINNAKFSWFLFKVSMVASIGMFTDAYDIFTIAIASTMIGFVYGNVEVPVQGGTDTLQALTANYELGLKVATLGGAMVGQLIFGWLADRMGRKKMYGIELIIMVGTTFAQAFAGVGKAVTIITTLIIWRTLMGIGIGGDYPLSAIIVSEFSPIHIRGRLMTLVIVFQGIGTLAAALVAFVVVLIFKEDLYGGDQESVDRMWRLLIGLGCIPAVIGFYFRFTIPETPRFTIDIDRNLGQALTDIDVSLSRDDIGYDREITRRVAVPKASWRDFIHYFSKSDNFKALFGASYSWFAIDAIFYGLSLNTTDLLSDNPFNLHLNQGCQSVAVCRKLYWDSATGVIIATLASVPGYWFSFAFADSWGRKPIQFMGFTTLGVIFITLGASLERLNNSGGPGHNTTVFFYCLACFFQNFGPNMSTFIIPGELFPTRYRSTCYGIAAASGKLGATISLLIWHFIKQNKDTLPTPPLNFILIVYGCVMLTAMGSTLWVPEPKGRSLESLSNETQEGFVEGYAGRSGRKYL